jgi:hypothetical protein
MHLRPLVAVAFLGLVVASAAHVHEDGEGPRYHCMLTLGPVLPGSAIAATAGPNASVAEAPSFALPESPDRAGPPRLSLPRGPPSYPCDPSH